MNNAFAVQIVKAPDNLSNNDSGVELRYLIMAIQKRHQVAPRSEFGETVPNEVTGVRMRFHPGIKALTRSVVSL